MDAFDFAFLLTKNTKIESQNINRFDDVQFVNIKQILVSVCGEM